MFLFLDEVVVCAQSKNHGYEVEERKKYGDGYGNWPRGFVVNWIGICVENVTNVAVAAVQRVIVAPLLRYVLRCDYLRFVFAVLASAQSRLGKHKKCVKVRQQYQRVKRV